MRICIFGAGAIGGLLAVKLAETGEDVSIVARGPHLAAIRENGLKLRMNGEETVAMVRASDDPSDLGEQDYVIVTLKAHSVPVVADKMAPLMGPETAVVTAQNGIPYWYFHGLDGPYRNRPVESVDPGGRLLEALPPERAIGCIVYPACDVPEPGVIEHLEGDRFTLGEPDGEKTERVQRLAKAFVAAGFRTPVRPRIRDEIWVKLWGNLCFNPLSALTRTTLDLIATDPDSRDVARAMMLEAKAVGEKLGVRFAIDVDKRIAGAAAVGAHQTSMLQDLLKGRPMEIDALVTSVQELGRLVDVPTPTLDVVLGLVRRLARSEGCYD